MRFRFLISIPFFLLALVALVGLPIIAQAQSTAEITCLSFPIPTDSADMTDCSIVYVAGEQGGVIEFEGIYKVACVPELDSTGVVEEERLIRVSLKQETPPDLSCPTVLSYYKIQSDPVSIDDGVWRVEVVVTDEVGEQVYVGELNIGPLVSPTSSAIYLPIVQN